MEFSVMAWITVWDHCFPLPTILQVEMCGLYYAVFTGTRIE